MKRLLDSFKIAGALLLASAASVPALASTIGTPLTPEITVASLASGYADGMAVARDASGNFVVVWSPSDGTPSSFRRFASDGTPLSDAIALNGLETGYMKLAMDSAGDFVIAWATEVSASAQGGYIPTIYTQVFSPDGTAKTAPVIVAQEPAYPSTYNLGGIFNDISLVMTPGGDFVVGWSGYVNYGQGAFYPYVDAVTTEFVRTRRYHLDGTAYGDATSVAFGAYPLAQRSWLHLRQMAMGPTGNYALLWSTQNGQSVQFYSATGKPTTKPLPLAMPGVSTSGSLGIVEWGAALAPNGDLLVADQVVPNGEATQAPFSVYYQRFSSQGVAKSAAILVAIGIDFGGLSIEATSSNGSMITWSDTSPELIYAQAYSSSDTPVADAFVAASNVQSQFMTNFVTELDPNDNLLVVWGGITAQLLQGP